MKPNLFVFLLLAASLGAQTTPIKNGVLNGTTTVPSGATLTVASGGTINLPDNALTVGDVSGLSAALNLKAPLASPTFTGTLTADNVEAETVTSTDGFQGGSLLISGTSTLSSDTAIGPVSPTELGYINGLTSSAQTQLDARALTGLTGATTRYALASGNDAAVFQGHEYLSAFLLKVQTRTAAKIVLAGDSTISGDGTTSPFRLNEIIENAAEAMGLNSITTVNNGHSGATTLNWTTSYLTADLAENPDLMICGYGLNDPSGSLTDQENADRTVTRYTTALTAMRAAKTVNQMSILVLVPNRCQDDPAYRTDAYFKAVRVGLQGLCATYKCALLDTPQLLRDPSVGGWINEDYSVGSNRYVHPTNVGNIIRAGAIVDAIFPRSLAVAAESAGIPNPLYPTGSKIGSDLPSVYPRGVSIYPATTDGSGTVFPYAGYVVTVKHASSYATQTNIFADSTPTGSSPVGTTAIRHGFSGTGWSDWYYPGVNTPAGNIAATTTQGAITELDTEKQSVLTNSAGLAAALSDETGTGVAVFSNNPTFTKLTRSGSYSQAAWGGVGAFLYIAGNTVTDTSTAASGTTSYAGYTTFHPPTLAASNATVTATIASTVYIGGPPAAGTNVTITNPYALHVDAGTVKIDEGLVAATVNGNTITTGTGTLTLGAGKTFTASNTLTLSGTDGSTLAIGTGGTLGTAAYTAATAYVAASGGTLTSPTIATGVAANGSGLKHARVTTGSVSAGSTALVTVTWGTAFADANYTVVPSVVDSTTSSLSLSVVHVESVAADAVTVRVLNNALGSLTGTVHVIAIHD